MKKFLIGLLVGLIVGVSGVAFAVTKIFPDVSSDQFYHDAVQQMAEWGVVSGYNNGNFGPNDPVTRGQLATILSRYNQKLVTYHGTDNEIGQLIDIVCSKIVIDNSNPEDSAVGADGLSLVDKKVELCKGRGESGVF